MEPRDQIKSLFDELFPPGTTIPVEEAWRLLSGPISSVAYIASCRPGDFRVTEQFSSIIMLASENKLSAKSALQEIIDKLFIEKFRRQEAEEEAKKSLIGE